MERLLDEAGQRAQEVERGAQAVEETAAVAAEEGEVAVAAEGVGGAFGYLGGLAEGAAALAPTAGEVAGTLAGAAGVGAAATAGLAVGIAGGAAYGLARGTGWVLENTLFRPQQGSEDAAVQDVRSANGMNDATQPQHFSLRTGSSTSGSPSSQSGFRVQAQSNNTPRPFSWGLNPSPSQARGRAPVPDAGACLRPALTSWRETLRLLKKNKKNPPLGGEFFLHGFLHDFALQNAITHLCTDRSFCTVFAPQNAILTGRTSMRRISFAVRVKMRVKNKHGGSHRRSPG